MTAKKVVLVIMILTLLSKFLGFGREIVLAYFYGTTNVSDAYLISITITGTIFSFVGIAIGTSFIPIFSTFKELKKQNEFTSNVLNITFFISVIISAIVLFFTEPIVNIFASGFDNETKNLAVQFTRISIVNIFFTGFTYVFTSFLKMKESYFFPVLAGVPFNLTILFSIIMSSSNSIYILPLGIVSATLIQLIIIMPLAYKKGFKFKFKFDLKDENINKMLLLILPVLIGTSIEQVNKIVDRTLASHLVVGGISALNYSNRLNSFVQGIVVIPVITILFPKIAKMRDKNNIQGLKKSVSETINGIIMLIIPFTFLTMLFSEQIVRLLFGRGEFNENSVYLTTVTLFYYSIGMIGFGLREVLSNVFYALHETKTPMWNAGIAVVINIILNLLLSPVMGISGLALATSVSAIICTILLFISLRKKIGAIMTKQSVKDVFKILLASTILIIVAFLAYENTITFLPLLFSLLISIGLSMLLYLILLHFFHVQAYESIINDVLLKIKLK